MKHNNIHVVLCAQNNEIIPLMKNPIRVDPEAAHAEFPSI